MKYIVLLTTSHNPSYRTRSFVKDLAGCLPGVIRVHRGKKTLLQLALEARRYGAKYVVVIGERKGNPSLIRIYHIKLSLVRASIMNHIASIIIKGVKLSRELSMSSKAYNIECVGVDSTECVSDTCFELADLFLKIFEVKLDLIKPDLWIVISEKKGYTIISFKNRLGSIVGPIIGVRRVKIIGREA